MNKYIIEMLKIQSSVILPGFGSLMIANSKTGKIVFNPHLKFNDGALAKFISEAEGSDEQAAQNQVAKFVREIEAELSKGNSYDMFEFGSFSKTGEDVSFKMDPKGAIVGEAKPADKPAAKAVPKKEEAKKSATISGTEEKAPKKVDKKAEKAAAKAKVAEDKAAAKAKVAEDKATSKAKAEADKVAAKNKAADNKAAAAKADADKVAAKVAAAEPADKGVEKPVDIKPEDTKSFTSSAVEKNAPAKTEEKTEVKDDKNSFVPADKAKSVTSGGAEKKKSAIERATGDAKMADEVKKPEIASGTKKENPQEKNEFKPADEKEDIGTSKAAATALAAAGKTDAIKAPVKEEKKDTSATKAGAAAATGAVVAASTTAAGTVDKTADATDKGMQSIKDKYKKSGSDKKQKPSAKKPKGKKVKDGEDGEKKKRKKWPLIVLLLLLIGGGTAGYIFKDKIMAFIDGDSTEVAENIEGDEHGDAEGNGDGHGEGEGDGHGEGTADGTESGDGTEEVIDDGEDEIVDGSEDEIMEDEVIEDEVVEDYTAPPVVDNSSAGGSYHVIGNAFSESGNADGYSASMKTKGYGSAKVLGKFDGLYLVSISQHDSQSSASSKASSVGDESWVFKWPK